MVAASASAQPRLRAVRVQGATPRIDGRLDEPAWRAAAAVSDFRQRSPESGGVASQASEVRVLFDEGALYVGLRLRDSEPSRVRRALGARDASPDADRVTVFIDPLRSRERGYYFQLNAAGVQSDGLVYDQTSLDGSWDAAWSGATAVDQHGWTAEMRIPLTGIVFQDSDEQRWGFYVERYVQRSKESSGWPAIPRDSNTFVRRFGELHGLRGLRRPLSLRLQPYAALELQLARRASSLEPEGVARPNAGLDARWAVSSDLMLAATLNPDFGQVEQDAAVVNLGPNEVWFGERRPFFVADADLFRTPLELVYTRRIGARPPAPALPPGARLIALDRTARILAAAKLAGNLGPVVLGGLSALVLPGQAVLETEDGEQLRQQASPTSHYGVARARWRFRPSASLGLLVTTLNRSGSDATSFGLDWDLRASSGWQTTGQLAGSSTEEGAGYGLLVQAGQLGAPAWRSWINLQSFSRQFQINQLGYQWRRDMVLMQATLQRRVARPWRAVREGNLNLTGTWAFNHTRPELAFDRRLDLSGWLMFRNLFELWAGLSGRFSGEDDRETRGGPAYPRPAALSGWVGGRTDSSRRLWADLSLSGAVGDGPALQISGSIYTAPIDRFTLWLSAGGLLIRDRQRWVETRREPGRPARYLFAAASRDELDLRLSGTLILHPRLSLTASGQLLHSVVRHDGPAELFVLDDGGTTLGPARWEPAVADFAATQLILGSALRWDFGGGAAAYLVYRLDGIDPRTRVPGFDLGAAIDGLISHRQNHLLVIKASYGWEL